MCGLFGFVHYGIQPVKDLTVLTNSLAEYSAVRGTDASGIAYFHDNCMQIQKEAKSAYAMTFKHPDNITALIGHTRHATHGDAKKNYNNHPFSGKAGSTQFALAHNGVLWNDREYLHLPKTKIETDSYIAVQLIEQQKKLTFDSLRAMAETVSGSFSFSVLNNSALWLVKGDSPLSLMHFPDRQLYVYVSTDDILFKALVDSPLFSDLKMHHYEEIQLENGTILRISSDGKTETEEFRFYDLHRPHWWESDCFKDPYPIRDIDEEYIDALRMTALYNGIEPEQIDELLEAGFSLEEIEDAIYEM